MKKIYVLIILAFSFFFLSCTSAQESEVFVPIEKPEKKKILYFDNVFSSFEYPGRSVNEIYNDKYINENGFIPFEGMFISAPVAGEIHFDESKDEPVIEYVTFTIYENDLSQDDCQAYLYNTYGALIAEGTDAGEDGQIYWRRYFTGSKLLKYSKRAKDDFYTITVE